MTGAQARPSYSLRDRRPPVPRAPIFKAILACGFRFGEIAALHWADFDEQAGSLAVRAPIAKGRRTRLVPVPAYLVETLRELRPAHAVALGRMPEPADLIFLSPKGATVGGANQPNVLKLFEKIREAAGIPKVDERNRTVDIHALRGTAATRMLRHGVSLPLVAQILGHSDVRLTMKHYTDLRLADSLAAIAKVPKLEAAPPDQVGERAGEADYAIEVGSKWQWAARGGQAGRSGDVRNAVRGKEFRTHGPCRTRTCNPRIMSPRL